MWSMVWLRIYPVCWLQGTPSSHLLRLTAQQAVTHRNGRPGRGGQRLERDRHGRAGEADLDETGHLGALPLILAAAGPDRVVAAPGPDRGLAEVVQPRAAAAAGGVQRLLREAHVAAGEVADHAAGTAAEPHRDLDVLGVRATDRIYLLGQAVCPPAQRVQEVTALAGEA